MLLCDRGQILISSFLFNIIYSRFIILPLQISYCFAWSLQAVQECECEPVHVWTCAQTTKNDDDILRQKSTNKH